MGSSKSQTVGYKYNLGIHAILTHGPCDFMSRFTVDDRLAWTGKSTGGPISVNAPTLFGGEGREGGVAGTFDLEMGGPTQGVNSYLQSKLGTLIPSFRGVVGVIMRQMYLGNNPYLKKFGFRLQRVHLRQDGVEQWYDQTAEILSTSGISVNQVYTQFVDGWETNAPTKYQLIGDSIANTLVNATNLDYWRIACPSFITRVYAEFTLVDRDLGDALGIRLDTVDGEHLFSFMPQTEDAADPLRRPAIFYWDTNEDDTLLTPIYENELDEGVLYSFEAVMDNANSTFEYWLRQGETVLANDTAVIPAGTPAYFVFGRTSNAFPSSTGICAFSRVELSGGVPSGDMNPAHIIRECLTDANWGMGYHDEDIDDVAFTTAADQLFAESMGMSLLWDRQIPIEQFINEVIKHIDAALYVDRKTGKFVLKLIRGGYSLDDLPVFNEDNIDKIENFNRREVSEMNNSVTVNYWDAVTGKNASTTATDPALVQQQGAVINTTLQYPGFTNADIANRVALRDLRSLSTPLVSFTCYVDWDGRDLNIGDVIKVTWDDYGFLALPVRISGLAFGDGVSNKLKLTCMQDVFVLPQYGVITPPDVGWEDPNQAPAPLIRQYAEEMPYYELVQQASQSVVDTQLATEPDAGMVGAAAVRVQAAAINARFLVDDDGSGYEDVGAVDFSPGAVLVNSVGRLDELFELSNVVDSQNIVVGDYAKIDDEYVAVVSLSGQYLAVKRAVHDTLPQDHAAGAEIFFSDQFLVFSPTEYVTSDVVDVKLLPTTGLGVLDEDAAPTQTVTLEGRAYRPYPPGNFKVDGLYYPVEIEAGTSVEFTWAHRDRTLQTGGALVGFKDGDVGPEPGVTYTLRIYGQSGALLREETGLVGTSYSYPAATETADSGGSAGTAYSAVVNAQAPQGYWRLNEASGNFIDTVGAYAAVPSGTMSRAVPGLLTNNTNEAVTWGSTTAYAAVAAATRWALGAGDFSAALMVRFTSTTFATVLAVRVAAGLTDMVVLVTTSRFINGDISAETWDWQNVASRVRTPTAKNDGNPHHVVVTYRHSSQQLRLYVDGVLVDTRTQAGIRTTGSPQVIIGNNTNFAQGFNGGTEDEVALFNTELSQAVITQMANTALSGPSSELNETLRVELESVRDGVTSWKHHDVTVTRYGYGFNYGLYYGGLSAGGYGYGNNYGVYYGGI